MKRLIARAVARLAHGRQPERITLDAWLDRLERSTTDERLLNAASVARRDTKAVTS